LSPTLGEGKLPTTDGCNQEWFVIRLVAGVDKVVELANRKAENFIKK
jgi:hypothetical protein